ncbi:glycosyltransferase family 4 protein [Hyphomicrobium sp.]|uniref:glycosyltransferase family 4 protein n=1 Tax=Hyphomicrobium sp. TaxID=82 RepID=UPI0025BA8299|nr:glycosyltransferase family 4 protein [Hyphomicrobium sp.]MCC7252923.1 glycosyltransferase family 4 protein [Hyphomicrobium sp.]
MAGGFARTAYRFVNGAATLAVLGAASAHLPTRVFYGGARSGDGGGPLVKARLLKQHFPDTRFGFSLVYLLSNALYLPDAVVSAIRARGIPIVLNQNGVFYSAWYPEGWERENRRMAAAYHQANHVFWQSEFCRRCADKFLGARPGAGEVLYNAADTVRFRPNVEPRKSGPFVVLVTGKIAPDTAYRLLSSLDGVAEARRGGLDAVLRIAGTVAGSVETEMRAKAAALGIEDAVSFTGPYSSLDAPDIYRSADAYLITKHNDPCPNVVIEAMASGLPVLYSASGGVPELVGAEAGIGLPVEESFERAVVPDGRAIAEGLSQITARREGMAVAARARAVERFGLENWIARHGAVFEQLVRDGSVTA